MRSVTVGHWLGAVRIPISPFDHNTSTTITQTQQHRNVMQQMCSKGNDIAAQK